MKATNLRVTLAREILATCDDDKLQHINKILNPTAKQTPLLFSDSLRQRIDYGLEQMHKGEVVTNEQVEQELNIWLGK